MRPSRLPPWYSKRAAKVFKDKAAPPSFYKDNLILSINPQHSKIVRRYSIKFSSSLYSNKPCNLHINANTFSNSGHNPYKPKSSRIIVSNGFSHSCSSSRIGSNLKI